MSEPRVPKTQPSPFRRRAFLVFTISIPFIFAIGLELGLRWFDYGVDVSLFRKVEIRHTIYYQMNPMVKVRYFGMSRFTPSTSPQYFKIPKAEGTYRIFCLGESTTAGYPHAYNGAFPVFLSERLQAIFPKKKVEVINLGLTATSSTAALDLLGEVTRYQPDLIIYYGGHNEFYGALGSASNQSGGPSQVLAALHLRLIHLRAYQLLRNTIENLIGWFSTKTDRISARTLMETLARGHLVPRGSTTYDRAYSTFEENLGSMESICRAGRIPIKIGTQVSDLRDQVPFVSGNSGGMTDSALSASLVQMRHAKNLPSAGHPDSALNLLRGTVRADSGYAEAHFLLAKCLDASGDKNEARQEYILARDLDELRFRTDSHFNNLIRAMKGRQGVYVADVEKYFEGYSPDSIIEHTLITEHLHPNSRGNFLLAKCMAAVMRDHGLFAATGEWASSDTLSDEFIWETRHVTDFDELMVRLSVSFLTSGWPFRDAQPRAEAAQPSDTLGEIARQEVVGRTDRVKAHREAIEYYLHRGDIAAAENEYEALISLFPMDHELYFDVAKLYLRQRRIEDVREVMTKSLEVYQTLQANRTIGDLLMQQGNAAGAVVYYEKMDEFMQSNAERVQNGLALSYAYTLAGRFPDARSRLVSVLAIQPTNRAAAQLLAFVNGRLKAGTE